MTAAQDIAHRVEKLVARNGCYRPVDLLVALRRLPVEALEQWRTGAGDPPMVLEDCIAGNPERWVELLCEARDWAEKRGLQAELRVPSSGRHDGPGSRGGSSGGRGRALLAARSPVRQQLLCTEYRRVERGPQMDLFFDNPALIARNELVQALLAGDATAAAQHLTRLDPAGTGHAEQTAAEVLVDALDWQPGQEDPGPALEFVEQHLEPAARTFLTDRADAFLRRYWRELARVLAGRDFDPKRPRLHPSWPAARAGDPAGVIDSIRAERAYWRHAELLARLFDAATALRDLGLMLEAIIELCWRDETVALSCLNRCDNADISRAFDRFCEAEPELPWVLFPAWLALHLPVPEPPSGHAEESTADPHPRTALTAAAALRASPNDIQARLALREPAPALFEHWMKGRE